MSVGLLLAVVFCGMFMTSAIVMLAIRGRKSEIWEKTLERLDSALAMREARAGGAPVDIRKQEKLSAIPWLNTQLARLSLTPRLKLLLYQANLKWTVGHLISTSAALAAFGACLAWLRLNNPAIAVVLGLAAGSVPLLFVYRSRAARLRKFTEKLPEVLELMVNALRAGHSLGSAIAIAADEGPEPVRSEFRYCADEQRFGVEFRTSMNNLMTRVPLPDLQITVTAILVQRESGGNLAEVMEKVAYVMRERTRLQMQIRVHTAQGRLTGVLLSAFPLLLGTGIYLISPESISILWQKALGIKLLWAAGIMQGIGAFVIHKIVSIKV